MDNHQKRIALGMCFNNACQWANQKNILDGEERQDAIKQETVRLARTYKELDSMFFDNVQQPQQNTPQNPQNPPPQQNTQQKQGNVKPCNKCSQDIYLTEENGKWKPKNPDGSAHQCSGNQQDSTHATNQADPNGPSGNTGSSYCNRCNQLVWWKKSQRTGKSFTVNKDGEFHSSTCGQSTQTTQENTNDDEWSGGDSDIDDIPF